MAQTALIHFGGDETILDTETAERALELALSRGDVETVHGLFVVDTRRHGEPALSSDELLVDELEDLGHDLLARFDGLAAAHGVDAETRCCHGTPHEELVAHAESIGADVVVVVGPRPPHRLRTRLEDVADVQYTRGRAETSRY
ncbi:MAG: universal stress protein [Haloarculaceae archaeon]